MLVRVELGEGLRRVTRTVELVTAPHAGDSILVDDVQVYCINVVIDTHRVIVRNRTAISDLEFQQYLQDGWVDERH